MKITSLDDFVEIAKGSEKKTRLAVVEALDEHTLASVIEAAEKGIIIPKLIGSEEKVREMLDGLGADPTEFSITHTCNSDDSINTAVDMINTGAATAIMKGSIETADFLRPIINKGNGLMDGGKLSLVGLFSLPRYHKIFAISDMAINSFPDLGGKKAIIENAVKMLNAVGIKNPKVAVLSAVEKLNPKMPDTIDADALKQMNIRGEIADCIIEGPISFDLATSAEAAVIKGYESPVAGDADLLVVPDVISGNILVKSLTGMAGALSGGMVLGAKVPIILTSRSAEPSIKYYSIAITACAALGMLDC